MFFAASLTRASPPRVSCLPYPDPSIWGQFRSGDSSLAAAAGHGDAGGRGKPPLRAPSPADATQPKAPRCQRDLPSPPRIVFRTRPRLARAAFTPECVRSAKRKPRLEFPRTESRTVVKSTPRSEQSRRLDFLRKEARFFLEASVNKKVDSRSRVVPGKSNSLSKSTLYRGPFA